MPTYHARGIVLKRTNLGEADRILTIFSHEHGKIRAVAKGVRRPKSRKAGHLELFNTVDLLVAKGRSLDIITQAKAVKIFPALREDLQKTGRAFYLTELVERFLPEHQPAVTVFNLLETTLAILAAEVEPARADLLLRAFELKLLKHLGFAPKLAGCAVCGGRLRPAQLRFDLIAGGVCCATCRKTGATLGQKTVTLMRFLQRVPLREAKRIKAPLATIAETGKILRDIIQFTLEREIKAAAFLDELAKN